MKKKNIYNPNQLSLFNFGEEAETKENFSVLENEWKEVVALTDKTDNHKTIHHEQHSFNNDNSNTQRQTGSNRTERGQQIPVEPVGNGQQTLQPDERTQSAEAANAETAANN
jgi:hypothetical protein